ncbi:hypothetical protein BAOM_2996 [Peribacillus asahii]|uniref:Uncharacterized protein n=1 Tax=Peribacillus asahii TaxID=228899 RepID=A0A3Q9RNI6_9BACI|nr:hypothetical protein [Peribacillus asahii]AZV43605.1 hypothetical protein BAOM_2996 [Peribacillus asahii]
MFNWIAEENKWIKKNVPSFIKVRKDYINTFLNEDVKELPYVGNGFNSDGEMWITINVLSRDIDIPIVILGDLIDNYEQVFSED